MCIRDSRRRPWWCSPGSPRTHDGNPLQVRVGLDLDVGRLAVQEGQSRLTGVHGVQRIDQVDLVEGLLRAPQAPQAPLCKNAPGQYRREVPRTSVTSTTPPVASSSTGAPVISVLTTASRWFHSDGLVAPVSSPPKTTETAAYTSGGMTRMASRSCARPSAATSAQPVTKKIAKVVRRPLPVMASMAPAASPIATRSTAAATADSPGAPDARTQAGGCAGNTVAPRDTGRAPGRATAGGAGLAWAGVSARWVSGRCMTTNGSGAGTRRHSRTAAPGRPRVPGESAGGQSFPRPVTASRALSITAAARPSTLVQRRVVRRAGAVSYTHLRAHETDSY